MAYSAATKLMTLAQMEFFQWQTKAAPNPALSASISATDTTIRVTAAPKDYASAIVAKPFLMGIRNDDSYVETVLVPSGSLAYDAQTVNFAVGSVLTGGTSGAKAIIVRDTDSGTTGTLTLVIYSGTFQNDETITDGAGGSATANGTLTAAISTDGLTLTGCVRGVRLAGLDYITGDATLSDSFDAGASVFCNISGVFGELLVATLNGTIATGGSGLTVGTEPGTGAETMTLYRTTTAGVKLGVFRWLKTGAGVGSAQFSNDGTNWVNNTDVTASDLVKVSAADTTPGYANDKITVSSGAGATVTKSITSPAGNEKLNIDVALNTSTVGVTDHLIYTPAFLTGGNSAQATYTNWLAVLDGSFQVTIDGVARSVTAVNFTGVTSMAEVATKIQTAIRTLTTGSETVTWSVNHFIITSGITTASSAITVTSAGVGGTDISGAGAADWMDCDTGHGTVTNTVLNRAADSGSIVKLGATGLSAKFFNSIPHYAASAVGTDSYAVTLPSMPTAYAAGMKVSFLADVANTGAATINVNGLGAKTIKKDYNADLETGDIKAGQLVDVEYDGTNFQLQSRSSKYFSKKITIVTDDTTIAAGSVTETALFTGSIPANYLGIAQGVKVRLHVTVFGLVTGQTCTLRLKYDDTTIATSVITNNSGSTSASTGRIEGILIAKGATNSQEGVLNVLLGTPAFHAAGAIGDMAISVVTGTAAEDSTGALNLIITGQFSNNAAGNTMTVASAVCELISG